MFSLWHSLFLFALLTPTFIISTTAADLVKTICSETQNPIFCLDFLGRLHRPGESLSDLAKGAIQSSTKYLFFIEDEARVREKQEINNPTLKDQYHQCAVQYTQAENALIKWNNVLQTGDYKTLVSLASLALKQPANCDLNFTPPGSEPDEFKSLNQKGGLCL